MKLLVEDTYAITSWESGKALPQKAGRGLIELNIDNLYLQKIMIVSTKSNLQGLIRWFICPGCARRIGKLFLPFNEKAFLCRHCYDLGYRKQFVRRFRKLSKKDYKGKTQQIKSRELKLLELLRKSLKPKKNLS